MRSEALDIDKEFIRDHGFGRSGSYVRISVEDTGEGMDERTREKIFEPFFTTKDVGKGTGLGLSMVYGIIEKHKGFMDVRSEPGKGTVFMVYLPSVEAGVKTLETGRNSYQKGGTETILIAEDDDRVRVLLAILLERAGYTVIEAVDGDDAVNKYTENKNTIDLVLCDVIMPQKNGKEVYDEIVKINPDAGVVFMSGYSEKIIQEKGIVNEGLNLVSKPVSRDKLLETVRNALDDRM
jgi:CheY-like chemotaxis protein